MSRVVVVGAGIYGIVAALRLRELGADVVVVDPRAVDDATRASGGHTRVLRFEYGREAFYTELVVRARERWRALERQSGLELYREVGVLSLVPVGGDETWARTSAEACRAAGLRVEELDGAELARRWPGISPV